MKGIVFNVFEAFLEEVAGEDFYDEILDTVELETDGPFIGPGTYPDSDLITLFTAAVTKLGIEPEVALEKFGAFLFNKLIEFAPQYAEGHNLKTFLLSIHDVIHVEVKKLYPEAITPDFNYEEIGDDKLSMRYESPRKLWYLALGLLKESANFFGEEASIEMDISDENENACNFLITFIGPKK